MIYDLAQPRCEHIRQFDANEFVGTPTYVHLGGA